MSDKSGRSEAPVKTEINVSGGLKVEGKMTEEGADSAADQVADGLNSFLTLAGWALFVWGASEFIDVLASNGLMWK